MINGNYIALTYVLITLAELWASAIGLSMIGLYCDNKDLALAMGVWYQACSLSSALSGQFAGWVALPDNITSPLQSLPIYQQYYLSMGLIVSIFGACMLMFAFYLHRKLKIQNIFLA